MVLRSPLALLLVALALCLPAQAQDEEYEEAAASSGPAIGAVDAVWISSLAIGLAEDPYVRHAVAAGVKGAVCGVKKVFGGCPPWATVTRSLETRQ